MQYGLYLPNFGDETNPKALAELAKAAEEAGWDGFFLWDHMLYSKNQKLRVFDPWVMLAAMAMTTGRIRLGTTVTPLARRRPWKLARETVTLDHLSGGRLILGVGSGDPSDADYAFFGDEADLKLRAEMLDEGLQILTGLWRGKPFGFSGKHYQLEKVTFLPTPVQQPRIPIWVGGFWPNKAPFRRAARWDGAIPLAGGGLPEPSDVAEAAAFIRQQRTDERPFDIVVIGGAHSRAGAAQKKVDKVQKYIEAGATWWLESLFLERNSLEEMRKVIQAGPPAP
jgi:alkanesulfonate monooxygenase SsuD/methylene tetrahydromethanopterin reductase-like flavin-dependent oxidoreductase (luciferase family)